MYIISLTLCNEFTSYQFIFSMLNSNFSILLDWQYDTLKEANSGRYCQLSLI